MVAGIGKEAQLRAHYIIQNLTKGTILADRAGLADSFAGRARGLLGRSRLDEGEALILSPCASVHTWMMRFAIGVCFVDGSGQVVKVVPTVSPWSFASARGARAAVELPVGVIAASGTECGDYLVWIPKGQAAHP